jgi:COMPASS component SWD3
MQGHSQGISDCAFTADSQYIASASDDRTAKLWEVRCRLAKGRARGSAECAEVRNAHCLRALALAVAG